jgi:hypothetical protein
VSIRVSSWIVSPSCAIVVRLDLDADHQQSAVPARLESEVIDLSLSKRNNEAGVKPVLPLIIFAIIGTVLVIVLYQLLIQKYYWGPKGPPKKRNKNKD